MPPKVCQLFAPLQSYHYYLLTDAIRDAILERAGNASANLSRSVECEYEDLKK